MKVAVVADTNKTLGGGLPQLRAALRAAGVRNPLWYEVPKAKLASDRARRALGKGADVVFAWGGDGTVRRCVEELAGAKASLAIVPAGTANLFATNMGIPRDIAEAVEIGLHGDRRSCDVGSLNGQRFAVMAGCGFDAAMIRDAGELKDRLGRIAYVLSGARNLNQRPFRARIKIDGLEWFDGPVSCVLVGNVGELFGGVTVFPDARPDDGALAVGVVEAAGTIQWARTIARTAAGDAAGSPFVGVTKAHTIAVKLGRKVLYELDGGLRSKTRAFKVKVKPAALRVCVPRS